MLQPVTKKWPQSFPLSRSSLRSWLSNSDAGNFSHSDRRSVNKQTNVTAGKRTTFKLISTGLARALWQRNQNLIKHQLKVVWRIFDDKLLYLLDKLGVMMAGDKLWVSTKQISRCELSPVIGQAAVLTNWFLQGFLPVCWYVFSGSWSRAELKIGVR